MCRYCCKAGTSTTRTVNNSEAATAQTSFGLEKMAFENRLAFAAGIKNVCHLQRGKKHKCYVIAFTWSAGSRVVNCWNVHQTATASTDTLRHNNADCAPNDRGSGNKWLLKFLMNVPRLFMHDIMFGLFYSQGNCRENIRGQINK